jgi:hypothetical protein
MRADHPRIRRLITSLAGEIVSVRVSNDPSHVKRLRLFHRAQVVYGVLLSMTISLNSLLRALDPTDFVLLEESRIFATDILGLAQLASCHRPLGASYIPPCLAAVVSNH